MAVTAFCAIPNHDMVFIRFGSFTSPIATFGLSLSLAFVPHGYNLSMCRQIGNRTGQDSTSGCSDRSQECGDVIRNSQHSDQV